MSRATNVKRATRNRYRLKKVSKGKVRLCVFRSNQHISAQLIDDAQGVTLASATSGGKANKATGSNIEGAKQVGAEIAKKAKTAKVTEVVFDRGHYLFHGRVKALADAAREGGLKF